MGKIAVIKLKQPLYLVPPNGEWTSEDTGIPMFEAGAENFAREEDRAKYDAAGIEYDVLLEVDEEAFVKWGREWAHREKVLANAPECGNHELVGLGFIRDKCVYDDDGECIFCGVGIPF
jgi:hypothetical protein